MTEPRRVDRLVVGAIHLDQVREHGGLAGVRDENALESALARPRQKWHDEQADLPTLAAAYGFGLCRTHPYRDGNKRVAFVVMVVFLELNGWAFEAEESEAVATVVRLADGGLSEAKLTEWIRERSRRRGRPSFRAHEPVRLGPPRLSDGERTTPAHHK